MHVSTAVSVSREQCYLPKTSSKVSNSYARWRNVLFWEQHVRRLAGRLVFGGRSAGHQPHRHRVDAVALVRRVTETFTFEDVS